MFMRPALQSFVDSLAETHDLVPRGGDGGRVVVDRARFERLLELARWADSYDGASGERNGLQSGDLDSLE
jgi:hypothetical protein